MLNGRCDPRVDRGVLGRYLVLLALFLGVGQVEASGKEAASDVCQQASETKFGKQAPRIGSHPPRPVRQSSPRFPKVWPKECKGTVFAHDVLIGPSGEVAGVWKRRAPCTSMERVVRESIQARVYEPLLLNGTPTPICVTVGTSVEFR